MKLPPFQHSSLEFRMVSRVSSKSLIFNSVQLNTGHFLVQSLKQKLALPLSLFQPRVPPRAKSSGPALLRGKSKNEALQSQWG